MLSVHVSIIAVLFYGIPRRYRPRLGWLCWRRLLSLRSLTLISATTSRPVSGDDQAVSAERPTEMPKEPLQG